MDHFASSCKSPYEGHPITTLIFTEEKAKSQKAGVIFTTFYCLQLIRLRTQTLELLKIKTSLSCLIRVYGILHSLPASL